MPEPDGPLSEPRTSDGAQHRARISVLRYARRTGMSTPRTLNGPDDAGARLVERAMQGDPNALEALFLQLLPRVRNLVRYLVRGDGDVDDLSQEALVKILDGFESYRAEGSFSAWADRVTVRSVFARLKRVSPTPVGEAVEQIESRDDSSGGLPDVLYDRRRVVVLLDELPQEQRDALVLHYVVGLSIKETADEVAAPEETVRSRIRLGKDRLKQWMLDPVRTAAG